MRSFTITSTSSAESPRQSRWISNVCSASGRAARPGRIRSIHRCSGRAASTLASPSCGGVVIPEADSAFPPTSSAIVSALSPTWARLAWNSHSGMAVESRAISRSRRAVSRRRRCLPRRQWRAQAASSGGTLPKWATRAATRSWLPVLRSSCRNSWQNWRMGPLWRRRTRAAPHHSTGTCWATLSLPATLARLMVRMPLLKAAFT